MSELMDRLKQAVLDGDEDEALAAAEEAIAEGMEPLAIVEQSIQPAMDEIGVAFQNGDAFLPELIIAGDAANPLLPVGIAIPVIAILSYLCCVITTKLISLIPGHRWLIG